MTDPATLRDATQIVLPSEAIDGHRADLQAEFVLTLQEAGERVRLIGSPVVISDVTAWLSRRGVFVP